MTFFLRNWLPLLVLVNIQRAAGQLRIYNDDSRYAYYGCYNETTAVNGSDHTRALANGINEVKAGQMTVPACLRFCGNGETEYRFAGLEWARECWCSQAVDEIAQKLDEKQCNLPCDGDNATACGGSLKLTVYRLRSLARNLTCPAFTAGLFTGVALVFVITL